MPLPPLALPPSPAVRIVGDVVVDPQAVLAPGVLLWAEAGAAIRIASGVCIGMGCIIHAHGGTIAIGEGVNIGAGVLLIGAVTVEPHACIGASTTVMQTTIPAGAVVAAGSLVGDRSRRWPPAAETSHPQQRTVFPEDPWQEPATTAHTSENSPQQEQEATDSPPNHQESPAAAPPETSTATRPKASVVYGQAYVSKMFAKMFRVAPIPPTGDNSALGSSQ
ncbi:carbon dioxide concentrating mechanism protein [Thermosynechococcus vestitus]|uniref:Carbon dioxide concentrating mechanism protein n=1 Tax=Thermosynechococcus vestitus (strain NIES-2133 / IAM M-273 / BP-1) TaxID=197221 RepID=Q8DKB6_THEVB|nr:carbon dioxide concentrating mechanism protein [Thermosynechococcus vestitus]BAC08495.1 carbon dioxide concentrating mechanism protein [Thermosynechococcus vestitus BP-1]BAY51438.1 carbon dioxide concentrating mechanism protein CcmN [Thermostichus vulcanus NIES-2134]